MYMRTYLIPTICMYISHTTRRENKSNHTTNTALFPTPHNPFRRPRVYTPTPPKSPCRHLPAASGPTTLSPSDCDSSSTLHQFLYTADAVSVFFVVCVSMTLSRFARFLSSSLRRISFSQNKNNQPRTTKNYSRAVSRSNRKSAQFNCALMGPGQLR